MPLENLAGNVYINALNASWPDGAVDTPDAGDDHIRGIKNVLKKTFPNMSGPVTRALDSLNRGSVPINSQAVFYQATAPLGWTRNTQDTTAMMRVITSAANNGGSSAGIDDPILNNKVASHVHSYSGVSLAANTGHTHTFSATSAVQSANHTHGFSATTDGNGAHSHGIDALINTQARAPGGAGSFWQGVQGGATQNSGFHSHSVSGNTGGVSANHTHGVSGTTSDQSGSHLHAYSGNTDTNVSPANWAPRYLNVILCTRTA